MNDVELVHLTRGDHVDCIHRGRIAIVDRNGGALFAAGDPQPIVWLRSLAKPFQAAAAVGLGAVDALGLTSAELALMAGSHSGTAEQTAIVRGVLDRIGIGVDHLRCGISAPLDRRAAERLLLDGVKPTALHHPCSGKHTGMLAAAAAQGWSLDGYERAAHPLQQAIVQSLAQHLSLPPEQIAVALDGCGVPTFGVPLHNLALGFARLGAAPADSRLGRVAGAMRQHPILFSGARRMDSTLMTITGSRLIAKDGTEGIFAAAVPEHGIGLALKISDGATRAIMPVVIALLARFDCITPDETRELQAAYPTTIQIHTGAQTGRIEVII